MLTLIIVVIMLCFGGVVFVGAPYLPTLAPQVQAALELADLQPGETLLELGCGDGKVLIAAAQAGLHVVGYELNPLLVLVAWLRTRRYGKNVRIIWGDMWHSDWPEAQAIFVFLLPKFMAKLDTKIAHYPHKPVKLVSFAFAVPDKSPQQTKKGVFLYRY
jgi:SAM-dependent methyltransferase